MQCNVNDSAKHNVSMDFLKVIATILVVRLHSGNSALCPAYTYYLAGCAVPIFFMVNGAFILNRPFVDGKYAAIKIFHISRLIFLWSIPYIGAAFLLKHKLKNPLIFVLDSFMQKSALANFWFLGALILIYLMLPLLYKIYHYNRTSPLLVTAFLGGICICIDLSSILMFFNGHETISHMVPQFLRLWTWLFYFCLGGIIYNELPKLKNHLTFKLRLLFIFGMSLLSGPLQYWLVNQWYHYGSPEYAFDNIIIIIWNISIMIFFALLNPTCHITKTGAGFISLTLGVYIIHGLLIEILKSLGLFNYTHWYINTFILIISSSAITYLAKKLPIAKYFVTL